MPITRGRLLTSLLLSSVSVLAWSDTVTVNTTTDETTANSLCSLRESVAYIKEKNRVKAIIDEEIAVISGNSLVVNKQLEAETKALAAEELKEPKNEAEITRLKAAVAATQAKIDAGLLPLKSKLTKAENDLKIELAKPESQQSAVEISRLNAIIADTPAAITAKETAKTAKEKELQDFRNAGINGCKTIEVTDADTITLTNTATPYEVTTEAITIPFSVNFTASLVSTSNDAGDPSALEKTSAEATPRTVIKAMGNHRLFIIDDAVATVTSNNSTSARVVSFDSIDFQGCNYGKALDSSRNICAVDGGIFLNHEKLAVTNGIISGGSVSHTGGAVYNNRDGSFSTSQALIQQNIATDDGGAIFSSQPSVALANTLLTKNKSANILAIANNTNNSTQLPILQNSTFSGNEGVAISAYGNLFINNLTIVLNNGGINLNNNTPTIYNTIIAGNNSQGDCLNFKALPVPDPSKEDTDKIGFFSNNVFQTGCALGLAKTHNRQISGTGNETLIADVNLDGKCDVPSLTSVGLLCPLAENGGLTKTHKPRLLASYITLDESPIVNKGFYSPTSNPAQGLSCVSVDQRQLGRGICDIGAVEIQGLVNTRQGQDITYGQTANLDLLEKIGDGELWPASQCQDLFGVGSYVDGCVRFVNLPTKGIVTLDDINDQVHYRSTLAEFHGFDRFTYRMTTTISRFSDADNDRAVNVEVTVVSDPDTASISKSLDSGATSLLSLLMLSLLMVCRRIRIR